MSVKTSNSKVSVATEATPAPKGMGTKGKLLLAAGAAIVAVAATEYALRKYTKTGGIVPNLRRLGKKGKKYLNKKNGLVSKMRRFAKKGKKVVVKKGKK
jgi:hypothetical protein